MGSCCFFLVHMYVKLHEELQQAEQTRCAEVEAMRKEVSQLTTELHQRDITIATLTGSTSSIERQLRAEVERGERRAAELKVQSFRQKVKILVKAIQKCIACSLLKLFQCLLQMTQVQLETLKLENQHLNDLLERVDSRSPKVHTTA